MRTVEAGGLPVGDSHPPRIMGVLNVSPESPYDPSVHAEPGKAARYADGLIEEGADIVDVGLASANKRFAPLGEAEELDRLGLAIETIEQIEGDAVFSIETRYAEVADRALDAGFDMVNDVCGFADPRMPGVCEAHDAAVVKMASPPDLRRPGAIEDVDEIYAALADGFTEKTIVDPAFGGWSEAKTLEDDRETFRRLREFRGLGRPILVSINRKNFLRKLVGRSTEAALPVSLGATAMAVERGANVIRTHDVAETRDAALIGHAFARERARGERIEELDVTTVREAGRHLDRLGLDAATAGGLVARTHEVSGLSSGEVDHLRTAAERSGSTFVGGDEGRAILGGTTASLSRLAASLDDTLDDIAGRIS